MTAQIIEFTVRFKSPSERRVDQLVETIQRVTADPSLARNEHELKLAQMLQARIDRAPAKK